MSKLVPLMELLIVTFNEKDSENVSRLICQYTKNSLVFQSQGSMDSSDSMWNFDVISQKTLVAIIPIKTKKELLIKLKACLELDKKHQGIAFTVPFSSAQETLVNEIKRRPNK